MHPPETFADQYSSLQIMRIVALVVAVAVAAAQKAADPDVKLLQKTSENFCAPTRFEYHLLPSPSISPLPSVQFLCLHHPLDPLPSSPTRFTCHPLPSLFTLIHCLSRLPTYSHATPIFLTGRWVHGRFPGRQQDESVLRRGVFIQQSTESRWGTESRSTDQIDLRKSTYMNMYIGRHCRDALHIPTFRRSVATF
jgi:hypothetical protein